MANKKVIIHSTTVTHINGRINLSKEMPADFIATSSKLSPRLPNVMMDEIKIAIGMAKDDKVALAYHTNFMMVIKGSPLPTRSSIYFHKVCIISTKNAIKKVTINGPKKDLSISLSNFFIITKM